MPAEGVALDALLETMLEEVVVELVAGSERLAVNLPQANERFLTVTMLGFDLGTVRLSQDFSVPQIF